MLNLALSTGVGNKVEESWLTPEAIVGIVCAVVALLLLAGIAVAVKVR